MISKLNGIILSALFITPFFFIKLKITSVHIECNVWILGSTKDIIV